ncbi:ion transporter [Rhodocytophaga aerolata]|uniref:Ion transporter n=1 Tax=Rhodocytophaga aerolata TaxID=455078 RepID=A0ABT8RD91_9BACT|nr:ion transporter [Rhodocytophaga aerolata]MDO1448675.1 ion transporter [Rhodocytophaga aerolata]
MISLPNTLDQQQIQPGGKKVFTFFKSLVEVDDEKQSPVIMYLILFNAFILFLHSFPSLAAYYTIFDIIDHVITIFFIVEVVIKIKLLGWRKYFSRNWHRFDFLIVVCSAPSILLLIPYMAEILPNLHFLLVLRVARILKFYRLIEFIPSLKETLRALNRALRASLFLILAFFVFTFVVSLFTYHIFKDVAPEYFGNGLISFYSIVKTVTGEGFNVADEVAGQDTGVLNVLTRFYFVAIILSGGIIGLSLVNTVFINKVTREANDEMEERLKNVQQELAEIKALLKQNTTGIRED